MGYIVNINRVTISDDLTLQELKEILSIEQLKYIQIGHEISLDSLELLNNHLFSERRDVQFRIYGFYDQKCDLKFLEKMTNVTDLSIGGIESVYNIDVLEKLEKLKRLRVSVAKLEDISFLENVNSKIHYLMLGTEMKNSKLSLDIIERFQSLKTLFTYKIHHGFNVVSEIKSLESLTINYSKVNDFTFLENSNIENLSIGKHNNSDYATMYGNTNLKRLELWSLNKILDLDILTKMPSLEYVKVSDLFNIECLPELSQCKNIKTLIFDNLKRLSNVSNLAYLPNIETIEFYRAKSINIDDIEIILKNSSLKKFKCNTGSVRSDSKINELIKKYNKD